MDNIILKTLDLPFKAIPDTFYFLLMSLVTFWLEHKFIPKKRKCIHFKFAFYNLNIKYVKIPIMHVKHISVSEYKLVTYLVLLDLPF